MNKFRLSINLKYQTVHHCYIFEIPGQEVGVHSIILFLSFTETDITENQYIINTGELIQTTSLMLLFLIQGKVNFPIKSH